MERKDPQSIGDVLRDLLQATELQDRMDELKAIELWRKVVGDDIAQNCSNPAVKNGIMTIRVPNASLRHELMMSRGNLRNIINEMIHKETDKEIIKEIRFIS